MIQALWTAGAGAIAQQYNVDTIANNIANADTVAFKRSRADMKDMPYVYRLNPMIKRVPNEGVLPHIGTGVSVASFNKYFGQGDIRATDRKLDVAIEGPGFFAVTDGQGNVLYTRDGAFEIAVTDGADGHQHRFLTAAGGYWLLDANGERIELPENASIEDIAISSDGAVSVRTSQGIVNIANIAITEFGNPAGLQALGDNLYAVTDNVGDIALTQGASTIKQGYLEASNVDLTDEITRMIQAQRAYELNARVLRTADEMMALANNIRS